MNKLLNLSPVFKSNDIFRLKKLHEEIEINTRALNSLGVEQNTYSAMLITVIIKLLPSDLALEYNRKNTDDIHKSNIQNLLDFIQNEIICRERTFMNKTFHSPDITTNRDKKFSPSQNVSQTRSKTVLADRPATTHNFVAAVERKSKFCVFCKENDTHSSDFCNLYTVEEKRDILRRSGRCYICLNKFHIFKQCTKKINCRHCKSSNHNSTICYKFNSESNKKKVGNSGDVSQSESKREIVTAVSHNDKNKILLQTCCVKLKNKNNEITSRLLLDTGSMKTFLKESIAKKLNLNVIKKEKLSIFSFGNKNPVEKMFDVVKVTLVSRNTPKNCIEIEALITEEISGSNISPPDERNCDILTQHFQEFSLADSYLCDEPITLLIGADNYYDIVEGDIKRLNDKLVAVKTIFGWCLQGTKSYGNTSFMMNVIIEEDLISEQIKKFWDLENSGLLNSREDLDPSNCEVMTRFENEIKYKNKRYEVKLPWRVDKENLNNNREIALSRFLKLKRKFCANPNLYLDYKNVLNDYLEQGIIEIVENEKLENASFYLPHHEVIKTERESSKLRIVYNASCHGSNLLSLNNCLHTGPNLYEDIFFILTRFRFNSVAFITDMKQAFLQILLDERDRNFTRFFFTKNPLDNSAPLLIFQFTRILFGLNCSPFLLAATIKHHLKKFLKKYPDTVNFLNENIYVDDIIGSHSSIEKASSVCLESINIFREASIQLHKWHTNSEALKKFWVSEGIISENSSIIIENRSPVKVLGMGWDPTTDTFYFDVKELIKFVENKVDTKRYVLQVLGRIFDPIGFIGPFTMKIKYLMQKIWSSGLDWDDTLPEDLKLIWHNWCKEVPFLANFSVPRHYFRDIPNFEIKNLQLHIFSDASLQAFGTVAYFRISDDEKVETTFVTSKNRIAPLKNLTLPRLELMGALLSAKLGENIHKALKMDVSTFYWTDSKITYFWIRGNPDKFKPFVKNRIEEIQKLTSPSDWHHCPGVGNPADLVTRGAKIAKLLENENWFKGPKWLCLPPEFWPKSENKDEIDKNKLEYRRKFSEIHQNECVVEKIENPIDVSRFSNFKKLLRVTGWVRRFVANLKKSCKNFNPLTAEEILEAEIFLIRTDQKLFYGEEYEALENNKQIEKNSSLLKFMPYLDDNKLLRLGGRLEFSDLKTEEKHPLILPKHSLITNLIVRQEHENIMHGGTACTLSAVRTRFWVPKGRQLVKSVIKKCLICQRYVAKHSDQISSPLPKERICETPPFSICGLDFAGPIYVKDITKQIKKAYIVLFTCGVTRALHLELVNDMTTESFLMAFRRFLARRGNCSVIFSDNAKSFKRAKLEIENLYKIFADKALANFLANNKIVWKNIIERAAWWGGFYERLVKSVKDCIKKVIGRALLTQEEMTTLLTEVETVLNLRPLTYVYNESNEPNPLTPMSFLNFGKKDEYPLSFIDLIENSSNRSSALRRKKYQSLLLRQLWKKWKTQYLLDLKTAHCLKNPTSESALKIGDVVLIEDEGKNKLLWKLARVQQIFPGRDKRVRSYELKTANGTLRRTIQHLYPLELN